MSTDGTVQHQASSGGSVQRFPQDVGSGWIICPSGPLLTPRHRRTWSLASLTAKGERVGEIHDSAVVGLRPGECELGYRAAVGEQPSAGAVCQRKYEQVQLVDQPVGEHRLNEAAAAADVDPAVDLVLEVTDLVRAVGAKNYRVVPPSGLQRG